MTLALKTIVQNSISTAIMDFAGAGSPNADPALSVDQQLKYATFGYGIYPNDNNRGPLVRFAVNRKQLLQTEAGMGRSRRAIMADYTLTISGMGRPQSNSSTSLADADVDAALLEEIIQQQLPAYNFGSTTSSSSQDTGGGRSAKLSQIIWQGSTFEPMLADSKTTPQTSVETVIFNMEFTLRAELIGGNAL